MRSRRRTLAAREPAADGKQHHVHTIPPPANILTSESPTSSRCAIITINLQYEHFDAFSQCSIYHMTPNKLRFPVVPSQTFCVMSSQVSGDGSSVDPRDDVDADNLVDSRRDTTGVGHGGRWMYAGSNVSRLSQGITGDDYVWRSSRDVSHSGGSLPSLPHANSSNLFSSSTRSGNVTGSENSSSSSSSSSSGTSRSIHINSELIPDHLPGYLSTCLAERTLHLIGESHMRFNWDWYAFAWLSAASAPTSSQSSQRHSSYGDFAASREFFSHLEAHHVDISLRASMFYHQAPFTWKQAVVLLEVYDSICANITREEADGENVAGDAGSNAESRHHENGTAWSHQRKYTVVVHPGSWDAYDAPAQLYMHATNGTARLLLQAFAEIATRPTSCRERIRLVLVDTYPVPDYDDVPDIAQGRPNAWLTRSVSIQAAFQSAHHHVVSSSGTRNTNESASSSPPQNQTALLEQLKRSRLEGCNLSNWYIHGNNHPIQAMNQFIREQLLGPGGLDYPDFRIVRAYDVIHPRRWFGEYLCNNHYMCREDFQRGIYVTPAGVAAAEEILYTSCAL